MSKARKIVFYILTILAILVIGFWGTIVYLQEKGFIPTIQKSGDVEIEKTSSGYRIRASSSTPISAIFKEASQKAGFHIYYPTFIPPELATNEESIQVEIGPSLTKIDVAIFDLGDPNSKSPWISVIQVLNGPNGIKIPGAGLRSRQEISLNGNKCVTGIDRFNVTYIFCSTKAETTMRVSSLYYDLDILIKVIQSMR